MNLKKYGFLLFVCLASLYLCFIFYPINKEEVEIPSKHTEDLIFYYNETYVKCEFLDEDEVYCIFKEVLKV